MPNLINQCIRHITVATEYYDSDDLIPRDSPRMASFQPLARSPKSPLHEPPSI
ncbi:hypothetical protein SODALDRAFT_333475, partial [Sodiomyces alkalinus F11]